MPKKSEASDSHIGSQTEPLQFDGPKDWSAWLKHHHATSTGVWLRLSKKGAARSSISYAQALEEALCYGWIDARSLSEGPLQWLKRFTPRSARSIWSKINRDKALALIAAWRMQPAGRAEVERAQQDGRWDAAYEPPSRITVPEDLQAALDANAAAAEAFAGLNSINRYGILYRIGDAKRAETRARRIEKFVAMLAAGEKLHP
jgi:uncharacterized protein YdeI (YjbR/CyaY-like superfamily)